MDLFKFFITDNKNGNKTKEKYLKKNYEDIYNQIMNFCTGDLSELNFNEKIWHFINNKKEIQKCKNCGKPLKFKRSISEGYGEYCTILCANKSESRIEKIKTTNKVKYGGVTPFHSEDIKNKAKETTFKNHGVNNIFEKKDYIKSKVFDKYGVTNTSKLKSNKSKREETCLNKYSVKSPLQLKYVRDIANESKKQTFLHKNNNFNIINYESDTLEIICDVCSETYEIQRGLFNYRKTNNINPCTKCNQVSTMSSLKEKELSEIVGSFGLEVSYNNRTLLGGKELDIVIPDKNIAIEFNGLFYHSDNFVGNDYHIKKTKLANEKGFRLIHIFEDEWKYKKDILISRLKNILGFTDCKIFARKCKIKEIDSKTKISFINTNHIQGDAKSSINLGLFYESELVSVMTFSKGRLVTKTLNYDYELVRFCNKLDTTVIGGASKLLKFFIENYQPKNIVSYADARWSNGDLYKKMGFELLRQSKPNYFYIIRDQRVHRFNYRKDVLVSKGYDPNKTEKEITKEMGLNRIYDCGSYVFHMQL